jgi:tripartite-type tricarboxylate transporter receptor subunit TctC
LWRALTLAAVCGLGATCALAQNFPARPIRLVVPFPAGGPSDFAGRLVSQRLADALGQPVIVDNRAGGSGIVGTDQVAKSPPDGYTLVIANVGLLAIAPSLYAKLPYDPLKELAPITNLVGGPSFLAVHPSLPVKNVQELIALARARAGQLNYASAGIGQISHLNGELFKFRAQVNIVHIPYKGNATLMPDVIGGQVPMSFVTIAESMPFVRSGKLRALAVTGLKRSAVIPEVPTVDQSGVPGFESLNWNGILAPAGTPREIVARLNAEIVKIVLSPELKQRIEGQGNELIGDSPEEFAAYIRKETDKWSNVIKQAGIKVE